MWTARAHPVTSQAPERPALLDASTNIRYVGTPTNIASLPFGTSDPDAKVLPIARSASSRRRGALATIAVLVFATVVAIALAEVTLRVYARFASTELASRLRSDPYAVLIEPHGAAGYRPRPGGSFRYGNGTGATINARGYRGPEVTAGTPPGTTRILLLGGSTTFGWGVDDPHVIESYMRAELERRFPGRRFEVVNLAFDGYDSWQIVERLRSDGIPLGPDFIIVNTGVNDVRNARFSDLAASDPDPRTVLWRTETERLRAEAERGGPAFGTRARHYLYLARLPGILLAQSTPREDAGATTANREAFDYFERNLNRVAALADSANAVLLLSSDPSSLRTKYEPQDTSFRSYWIRDAETTQSARDSLDARLRGVVESRRANGQAVHYIGPADISPQHFLDDTHLTAEGNRLLALHWVDALAQFLHGPGARAD